MTVTIFCPGYFFWFGCSIVSRISSLSIKITTCSKQTPLLFFSNSFFSLSHRKTFIIYNYDIVCLLSILFPGYNAVRNPRRKPSKPKPNPAKTASVLSDLCTPGTGVNLWGVRLSGFAEVKKSPVREPKGVHGYGYYQKYEPKASAEGRPTVRRKPECKRARRRTETAYKA